VAVSFYESDDGMRAIDGDDSYPTPSHHRLMLFICWY